MGLLPRYLCPRCKGDTVIPIKRDGKRVGVMVCPECGGRGEKPVEAVQAAVRSVALAIGLALASVSACEAEDHPPDVITAMDLTLACAPRPRPAAWLERTKRVALAGRPGSCCEWDHRIPRCMGGADDLSNLWLEPCSAWRELANGIRVCVAGDAYRKDLEEASWCRVVCDRHSVPLDEGQQYFREWKD